MTDAEREGLTLDPTYTAKTFAAALDRVEAWGDEKGKSGTKTVLYWHTLSSAPVMPLLASAPNEEAIDAKVRELFA
jgi:hypothetical protein